MVRYPVFIPCRDRLTPLLELIAWLERVGQTDIYLLDNDSTYPPLLDHYNRTNHQVILLGENHGPRAVWSAEIREKLNITGRFILTDPDVVPIAECPDDAIEILSAALDHYPDHVKAGFGIRIDDLPDHFPRKAEVINWEHQHWTTPLAPGLYDTTLDTTFALYRPGLPFTYGPAIRTGYPYLIEHTPWYSDPARLSAEEAYYFERAKPNIATWKLSAFNVAEGPGEQPEVTALTPVEEDGVGFRKDILLIVPTRSRPEHSVAFADAFFAYSSGRATLLFALDDDDPVSYPRIDGVLYEVNPRLRLAGTLNLLTSRYRDDFEYLAFMDDDQRICTVDWDHLLAEAIEDVPAGIAFVGDPGPDDAPPAAVLMRSTIARTLGYVVPPDLVQAHREDVWRALGHALGSLRSVAGIAIEHPAITKEVSATPENRTRDREAYERYVRSRLKEDVVRIRTTLVPNYARSFNPGWLLADTAKSLHQGHPLTKPSPPTDNDVLVIVPTRSRPEKSIAFAEAFLANSTRSDLLFGLDEDDHDRYPRIPGVHYDVNPRLRFVGTVNLLANRFGQRYAYIAILGDDFLIRTHGWDHQLVEAIEDLPFGIAYGNDLNQGEALPTHMLMNTAIVRTLGYVAPPTLTHLFADNFWRRIGQDLDSLRYVPDVILEHLHYTVGKSAADPLYLDINSHDAFRRDADAFAQYEQNRLLLDLQLLRQAVPAP